MALATRNQAELLFIALQSRVHTAKLRATLAQPRQPVASSRSRLAYSTDGHDSMLCSNRNRLLCVASDHGATKTGFSAADELHQAVWF